MSLCIDNSSPVVMHPRFHRVLHDSISPDSSLESFSSSDQCPSDTSLREPDSFNHTEESQDLDNTIQNFNSVLDFNRKGPNTESDDDGEGEEVDCESTTDEEDELPALEDLQLARDIIENYEIGRQQSVFTKWLHYYYDHQRVLNKAVNDESGTSSDQVDEFLEILTFVNGEIKVLEEYYHKVIELEVSISSKKSSGRESREKIAVKEIGIESGGQDQGQGQGHGEGEGEGADEKRGRGKNKDKGKGNPRSSSSDSADERDEVASTYSTTDSLSGYDDQIFSYLQEKEQLERTKINIMECQSCVTDRMRAILVDWLVDVQVTFKLVPETLFISVQLIDRYLCHVPVQQDQLQLLGIASLLIATKFEEIYPPEISDFIFISDSACSRAHVLKMERNILCALNFHISFVTPLNFLRRISHYAKLDFTSYTLAKYMLECMLLDVRALGAFPPSLLATATVYAARRGKLETRLVEKQSKDSIPLPAQSDWAEVENITGYPEEKVKECARYIRGWTSVVAKSQLKSIYKKYSSIRFESVATFNLEEW